MINANSTVDTNGNAIILSGTVDGTANLVKIGAGTLTLSGTNVFTGFLSVNNGTLSITNAATGATAQSLGEDTTDAVTLGVASTSSGILQYTGPSATLDKNITSLGNGGDMIQNAGTGLLTLTGTLGNTGTLLTLSGGSSGLAISGPLSGTSLVIAGGATTLNVAPTETGIAVSGSGTLVTAVALPSSAALTLGESVSNTSGVFDLGGVSQTIASLNTSGTGSSNIVTNNGSSAATLTVSTSGTFGGTIQNGSKTTALTLSGGSLLLTGASTYTGATNVNGGTLIVSGSIGGTTGTVAAGATLASGANATSAFGTAGANTLTIYGTLAPGSTGGTGLTSIGKFSTGALTLGATGTTAHLAMEIGGVTSGTGYDEIAVRAGSALNLTST